MDWIGNATSVYVTHGASNHSDFSRAERDYYATDPEAVEKLLEVESFNHYIYEPACGGGHVSKVLIEHGYDVVSRDIVDRGSEYQTGIEDFLKTDPKPRNKRDIITNPPYKFATEFAEHALDISQESVKIAMFLKLTFLEGAKRKRLFDKYPPRKSMFSGTVWIAGRTESSLTNLQKLFATLGLFGRRDLKEILVFCGFEERNEKGSGGGEPCGQYESAYRRDDVGIVPYNAVRQCGD